MSYRRQQSTESKIVVGFFRILWWIISLPFRLLFGKSTKKYSSSNYVARNPEFVREKWQEIDQLLKLGSPSNFSRAVLEADKLLDHVLKSLRAPGLTMGDRLKASRNKFSPEGYDAAWRAHRVRNELVHNAEFQMMDYNARSTIANYRKSIGELTNLN